MNAHAEMNAHAFTKSTLHVPINIVPEPMMLSRQAFKQIQSFFHQRSGIFIPESKEQLIVNRLRGHMLSLGFEDFDRYCTYLANESDEQARKQVVDLLTTNETYFFREHEHFSDLKNIMLPAIRHRPVRVWCAAASSGEEPYSLAMVLADTLGMNNWELIASDISNRVLERAEHGLYRMQRMENMPQEYLRKYCRKGIGNYDGMFMVNPELRERVQFTPHNLLESAARFGQFDIIFVRNVMIYFDAQVKNKVLHNMYEQLRPGGWLVTSHSESLLGMDISLKTIKPSVYQRA